MDSTAQKEMRIYLDIIPEELIYIICQHLDCELIEDIYKLLKYKNYTLDNLYNNIVRIKYIELYPGIVKMKKYEKKYSDFEWRCLYRDINDLNYEELLRFNKMNIIQNEWFLGTPIEDFDEDENWRYKVSTDIIYGALLIINDKENYEIVRTINEFVEELPIYNIVVSHYIYNTIYHPCIKNQIFMKDKELKRVYNYKEFINLLKNKHDLINVLILLIWFRHSEYLSMKGIKSDINFINKCERIRKKNCFYEDSKFIKKFLFYIQELE